VVKHPVIVVPDVGEVDHAWDLLGPWRVIVLRDGAQEPIHGALAWASWECGTLEIPGNGSDRPALRELLTRVSSVQRAAAGGGALTFLVEGPQLGPLIATLWPGDLQLTGPVGDEGRLSATARRSRDYYRRKYPLEPV